MKMHMMFKFIMAIFHKMMVIKPQKPNFETLAETFNQSHVIEFLHRFKIIYSFFVQKVKCRL